MGKHVLVTGGAGFIGRVLVSRLIKDQSVSIIHVVDNLCNSQVVVNDPLFSDSKVSLEIKSIKDYTSEKWFDEIYHLASPVGPVGVLKYPGIMGRMILNDTLQMAELAIQHGAKLIDISTSEVYGKDPQGIPQKENIEKIIPSYSTIRLEYGASKLLCEIALHNLMKVNDLRCNIIRPYNIISFGQQASAGFVLPRFLEQAIAGDPITVYKPGTQRRTFTDVRDFVDALLIVMKEGTNGEIYNIGNPANLYSIMDFAMAVKEATGSSSNIEIVDPKKLHGDLFEGAWEKIPDIIKITTDTSWCPKYTLDDIIQEAVSKYRVQNSITS